MQRLIVARALPRTKLSQVLEALQQGTSAGLDVQLKILQALPSLLSNYAVDVKGELLVTALNICFILQSSKNAIVNNTSAATLQQLVVSVFDKVVVEDSRSQCLGALLEPAMANPVQNLVPTLPPWEKPLFRMAPSLSDPLPWTPTGLAAFSPSHSRRS